ncbi:MAG: metallophosphoesterase [Planctomycetes bacterium]|nr:metallophosphoesterase [Planctomycetota bacterium]
MGSWRWSKTLNCLILAASAQNLAAPGDAAPPYDRRPYLQSLSSTSVLIVSQSEGEASARLRWGPAPALEHEMVEAAPAQDHVFKLEGLEPGASYHYQVRHGDLEPFPAASFRTLPRAGSEVRIAVIGDSGTGSEAQLKVAKLLLDQHPDLLLHNGDLAYPAGIPEIYQKVFFEVYGDLLASTCIYPVLGNHDCFLSSGAWRAIFHLPADNPAGDESYYSFDAGDAHFAAVNSCDYSVPEEEVEWLERDLGASSRPWKIVYLHHTIYSNGSHGGTLSVRKALLPVLERQRADLVMTGHDHVYERSYPIAAGLVRDAFQDPDYVLPAGTVYVVSGGGGAATYPYNASPDAHMSAVFRSKHHAFFLRIAADRLEGTAIGLDGAALDRFIIRKSGRKPKFSFQRGDANEDGELGLSDPIAILLYLFRGAAPPCLAAADVDASGEILIDDAIALLIYLYLGGLPPASPFPACGGADRDDGTGCMRSCGGQG